MAKRVKLKDKRERFTDEYLLDFDGPAAAIRAGYSEHSAYDMSSRLLNNEDVKSVLDRKIAAYKKKYEIRREFIVDKLNTLVTECINDKDRKHLVKALDMLSKMSGQYSQTVINLNQDQPLFPDNK